MVQKIKSLQGFLGCHCEAKRFENRGNLSFCFMSNCLLCLGIQVAFRMCADDDVSDHSRGFFLCQEVLSKKSSYGFYGCSGFCFEEDFERGSFLGSKLLGIVIGFKKRCSGKFLGV